MIPVRLDGIRTHEVAEMPRMLRERLSAPRATANANNRSKGMRSARDKINGTTSTSEKCENELRNEREKLESEPLA